MTSGRFAAMRASEISWTSASGSALGTIGLRNSSPSHFLSTLLKTLCYFGILKGDETNLPPQELLEQPSGMLDLWDQTKQAPMLG